MHSSRMRTDRRSGHLGGGVSAYQCVCGVSAQTLPLWADTHLWTDTPWADNPLWGDNPAGRHPLYTTSPYATPTILRTE